MTTHGRSRLSLAKSLLSWPLHRIRWKIMVPYAVLTLVFAALATYSITRMVTSSLKDRFDQQLVEVGRVSSDAMVRRERAQLSTLRSVSFTEGLANVIASGDNATVARLVGPLAANAKAERVEVLDTSGNTVFATRLVDANTLQYEDGTDGANPRDWSAVTDVLAGREDESGNKWAQIAQTPNGLALYTVGPVKDSSGRLAGVVMVGSLLDSVAMAAKAESLADVTIYDLSGQPLATTFAIDRGDLARLAPGSPLETGSIRREPRTVFGRDYAFLYGDLRVRNEVVGRVGVALPSGSVGGAGAATQWQMSAFFGIITLLVMLTGWVLAHHITEPLSRLVAMARAVSRGDLSARSGVQSSDEIGTLAATFDTMAEKLQRQHLATIGALASAIDARDPYTAGHSMRVGDLSAGLGGTLGLPNPALHHLRVGGILHDIGKIGIRDEVLLKPGALTVEERLIVQQHPSIGLRILEDADLPPNILAVVGSHHERLNGSGYPRGLSAEDLSILPRIVAVADVYDALTTSRPYRKAMTPDEAVRILRREAMEGLLDPEVVAAMIGIAAEWEERLREVAVLTAARAESLLQMKVA